MLSRLAAFLVLVAAVAPCTAAEPAPGPLTFEEHIRPILKAHCFDCHGAGKELKGGLDLRLRRLMVKGGDSGPAIQPGDPSASYLVDRVKNGEMPPGESKVSPEEIAILVRWVESGAPTARDEPAEIGPGIGITPEERQFWSFQPIKRPPIPDTASDPLVRTPVDAFLLAKLREHGLSFSPEADRVTLLRRASFDLTGLPPTPEEAEQFLSDDSPLAYERLIERLLASPHYGERWGRHWLDVAGYADSEGYTNADVERPHAYRYRDYVIRSFNDDKPFDQFITEQLAGDELAGPRSGDLTPQQIEQLTATGFLRMAADGTSGGDVDLAVASNQTIADTIKIVSTSLLGLSVGCAQCHDHRYDPILQRDYYSLRACFEPALNWKNWRRPQERLISLYTEADRAKAAEIEAEAQKVAVERNAKQEEFIAAALEEELKKFDESLRPALRDARNTPPDKRTPEQKELLMKYPSVDITPGTLYQYNQKAADELKQYDAKIAEIRAKKPVQNFIRVLDEPAAPPPPTFLFYRGDHQQPTEQIQPAGLTVVSPPEGPHPISEDDPNLPTSGRRLALARWLTSGKHPLVTRVLVNRVWMHHFGRGIVNTPSDFGALGERPTHPELLDWLADEFVAQGWSLKNLHRLLMLSTAYRQSSLRNPEHDALDPENTLLARASVRRLDAEVIRDAALVAAGRLNTEMFGSPVPVKEDAVGQIVVGVDTKQGANQPGAEVPIGAAAFRRSVYIQVRRSRPLAILRAFDLPVMETNCDRRIASTSPTQSLMLMNSRFATDQAAEFAARLRRDAGDDPRQQVTRAWKLAYTREPAPAEMEDALAFLQTQTAYLQSTASQTAAGDGSKAAAPDPAQQALTNLCQSLLSSNEFLYVD